MSRFNWDHIFSPTLLNHFAYGYVNRNEGYGSVPAQNPADLPQIPNAVAYLASPQAAIFRQRDQQPSRSGASRRASAP